MPTGHIPILQIKTKDGEWLPVNAIGGQVAIKVLYNNAYATVEQALDYLFANGTGGGGTGTGGITPHIGANGNWYIGDIDTGKPSRGEKGDTPVIGVDYWTEKDKQEIIQAVLAAMPDGTKEVY